MKDCKIILPLFLVMAGQGMHAKVAGTERPNIIFIVADDLGWTDLGISGSDYYETPAIDRLASEGMMFDNAYSAAANSAPSRACMMSGMYTPRHGIYTVSPSERGHASERKLIPVPNTDDLDTRFVTIAEALSAAGYRCGHIGKWHLGDDADGTGPLAQGFDTNTGGDRAGAPYSYFYPYCLPDKSRCHHGLSQGKPGEYLTDRLTDEAVKFIKESGEQPFFLHLAHFAVHTSLQAPEETIEKYRNKPAGKYHSNPVYAAMIEKLDDSVRRICDTVDSLGMADNTLIVFWSDNGGSEPVTDNWPLRGGKGTPYEGGDRVPLIIRWNGHTDPGTVSSVPVCGIDFFPTFISVAGADKVKGLDGKDIFSLVSGKSSRRDLFWHFPAYLESYTSDHGFRATPYSSIRSGDWKLIHYYEDGSEELFDLSSDPGETENLSLTEPGIRKRLHRRLFRWLSKTNAPIPHELNPEYIPR